MKRLAVCLLAGLVFAAPASAASIEKTLSRSSSRFALVDKVRHYLPHGEILNIRRVNRRVIYVHMIEHATPKNDWFGLPPEFWDQIPDDAVWDTLYSVHFGKRYVRLCVSGMGVIKQFPRRAGR